MFENIMKFMNKFSKKSNNDSSSKNTAKERLHLVLMQDRANVSADFLDLMRQEIIDVIKKYIEVDESAIDVRLTNKENEDGTNGAPALYANIPILNIREDVRQKEKNTNTDEKKETDKEATGDENGEKSEESDKSDIKKDDSPKTQDSTEKDNSKQDDTKQSEDKKQTQE